MPRPNKAAQQAARSERAGLYSEAAHRWIHAARQATGKNINWCQLRAEFCAGVVRRSVIKDPQ